MKKTKVFVLSIFCFVICLVFLVGCTIKDTTDSTLATDNKTSDLDKTGDVIGNDTITDCLPDDYAPGMHASNFENIKTYIEDEYLGVNIKKQFSEQKRIYQAMYDSFNAIGYFYSFKTVPENAAITLVDKGEYSIYIFPYFVFESAGIRTLIYYKEQVYHVMIYQVDKTYVEENQTLSDYISKKAGIETYGETVIGDNVVYYADYNNKCGGLSYIDENYFYHIRPDLTTVPIDELNELLSIIEFEKIELSPPVKYNSTDYSQYDLEDYIVIDSVYDENLYKDIVPEEEKTVVIDGKEITGYYEFTTSEAFDYFPSYIYHFSDNSGYFCVDETGKITAYSVYQNGVDKTEALSENKYISIAKDFVNGILNEDTIDWSQVKVEKDGFYIYVVFERYLNEIKTAERFFVEMTRSGDVCWFSAHMLGRIPDDIDLSAIESPNTEIVVYRRLDEINDGLSKETRENYKITYCLPEPVLSVLADGTPCFIYDARINFTPVVSDVKEYFEIERIIVTLSQSLQQEV